MSLSMASRAGSATGLAACINRSKSWAGSRSRNKNAATGLWFSDCISPFRRMPRPDSAGAAGAIFLGAGPRQRSLEDLLLGQLELHLQLRPAPLRPPLLSERACSRAAGYGH